MRSFVARSRVHDSGVAGTRAEDISTLEGVATCAPRVWIDLSNSPHARLFAPIAERLERGGAEVLVTARDHAQTVALARSHLPGAEVIGAASMGGGGFDLGALVGRVRDLARWARATRPDVALSHNSYAQLVAASVLRIPSVTAMDYEYQPANHLAFRLAERVLLPAALPEGVVRRQGARARKTVRYEGLKEELYLAHPGDDRAGPGRRGGSRSTDAPLVVARAEPTGAAYHRRANPLFIACLRELCIRRGAACVVLVRHESQRRAIEELGLPSCSVPTEAVEVDSLLLEADAFLGGGGTMTREAALLGVPTFSVFSGRRPAVDRLLESEGRLQHITTPSQISLDGRRVAPVSAERIRERGAVIEATFAGAVFELLTRKRGFG